MSFYEASQNFVAVRSSPPHGICTLTRGKSLRSHMRGRPCGLLAAWLAIGGLCETKEEHYDMVDGIFATRQLRLDSRAEMASTMDGVQVLRRERKHNARDTLQTEP